jgi:hypothetical protein
MQQRHGFDEVRNDQGLLWKCSVKIYSTKGSLGFPHHFLVFSNSSTGQKK